MAKSADKIVIVTPGGVENGGGIGRMMGYIADELERRGHGQNVVVLDSRGPGSFWLSPFYLALCCLHLSWMMLRGDVAIVHTNPSERMSFPRKFVVVKLARLFGVPVIAHKHGADFLPFFDNASGVQRWIVTQMLRSCQKVLVLGEHYRRHLIDEVGVEPDRILRLYNAIPSMVAPGADLPPLDRLPSTAAKPASLVMLANISVRKGADVLLKAASTLKEEGLAFNLTLAGGGEIETFRNMAAERGLASCTDFPGWIDRERAHELLRGADAMLLPSRAEGLPIAILEALSLGIPIVTTPVGAIHEVLDDGKTAMIVPPGDVDALTDVLRRLLKGEIDARAIARNGQRLFEDRFDIKAYGDQLIAIYSEIIAEAGREPPSWASVEAPLSLPLAS